MKFLGDILELLCSKSLIPLDWLPATPGDSNIIPSAGLRRFDSPPALPPVVRDSSAESCRLRGVAKQQQHSSATAHRVQDPLEAAMAFCSPKLDQVSANKIIEESIRREERTIRLGTEFTVHSTKKSECAAPRLAWPPAA